MNRDYVVHLPTGSRPSRGRRAMQWAKLGFVTLPSLGAWLLLAMVRDLLRQPAARSAREASSAPRPSPALVPAQVGSSPGVAVGQDGKAAIDRS
jgi:hypothetical protein